MARTARSLGILALLAFVLGPTVAHFEIVAPMVGFTTFGLGILLGVVATVLGVVALIRGRDRSAAAVGLLAGVVVLAATVVAGSPGVGLPAINDITTDTENPPAFVRAQSLPENEGRDLSYPGEEFASQQREGYPQLAAMTLTVAPDQAFARVQLAARGMDGWTITREDVAARALEGYDTSRLFRFKDDFVIEVRPADGGSVVHMRSKSRDGRGDVGVNARRIESFLDRLD